jgi:hypothetical protein
VVKIWLDNRAALQRTLREQPLVRFKIKTVVSIKLCIHKELEVASKLWNGKIFLGLGPITERLVNRIDWLFVYAPLKARRSTGWPDWANFRILGDYLFWAVFFKLQKQHKCYVMFFRR